MAIVYRAIKGSRLTVTEIDGNFEELSDLVNTKVDSADVRALVDSAYVQARQLTFDFLDSGEVIALIDSAYVQARQVDLQRDSSFITNIVDSAYISARQDYSYGLLTGAPTNLSTFTNDTNYLDSTTATNLVDSAYIQARQLTFDFMDSAEVVSLIDSAYIRARQIGIDTHTTTDLAEGTNLYYTTARADSDFDTRLATKDTNDLTEGTSNLYYTDARAQAAITAGTGVTVTAGEVSIGQSIGTNDSPSFQGLSVDNLTVHGTQTIVNTQSLTVTDPMITLARNNRANINDIGFFGEYSTDGSTLRHAGLFRDASDNQFHLFEGLTDSPTTYVDTTAAGYQLATLNVGTINASNILDSNHVEDMITSLSTDSAAVFLLVDSAYIQARQTTYDVPGTITSTVDAAYVQARQDFAYGSLTGAPTNVSTFTNDANYVSDLLNIASNLVPDTDSARDLGTSSKKWRELHLSGNTIHLGGEELSTANSQLRLNGKSLFDYTSDDDALVIMNDRYIETSAELTDAQILVNPLAVTATWSRFSHSGTAQPLANTNDADAWFYNSSNQAIENPLNTGSATGFYSPKSYTNYTHQVRMSGTTSTDDDIMGVVIAYVIENGEHHTLSVVRQTHGGVVASGLTWGLVYNIYQTGHTDTTRNQALLVNGTSLGTAGNSSQYNWNAFPNGTTVKVVKTGSSISCKTSEFNSTSLDDNTEITFDLSSDTRTQRFVGAVPYGYLAISQGPASFSNIEFTSDTNPESIIHFQKNGATDFYEYNNSTGQWDADTTSVLADKKGKFYHNGKTGRTFFNDGNNVFPIGTVKQFNDVIYQVPQAAEPDERVIGSLGLQPGMFAVADGTNWDPASKGGSVPYPVFWDGSTWNALY